MGKITNIKSINEEKVNVTLELEQEALQRLQGNMDDMHVFSEKNLEHTTRLVQRGRRDSTKYLLLPRELRKDTKPTSTVRCSRINGEEASIFIFTIANA